jgi:hypothetical protein
MSSFSKHRGRDIATPDHPKSRIVERRRYPSRRAATTRRRATGAMIGSSGRPTLTSRRTIMRVYTLSRRLNRAAIPHPARLAGSGGSLGPCGGRPLYPTGVALPNAGARAPLRPDAALWLAPARWRERRRPPIIVSTTRQRSKRGAEFAPRVASAHARSHRAPVMSRRELSRRFPQIELSRQRKGATPGCKKIETHK